MRGDTDHPIIFSALNKEELQSIDEFLRMKKVRVKNEMDELAAVEAAALGDDDDDDDDDAMDVDAPALKGVLAEEDDEDSEGESPALFSGDVWFADFSHFCVPQSTRISRLPLRIVVVMRMIRARTTMP